MILNYGSTIFQKCKKYFCTLFRVLEPESSNPDHSSAHNQEKFIWWSSSCKKCLLQNSICKHKVQSSEENLVVAVFTSSALYQMEKHSDKKCGHPSLGQWCSLVYESWNSSGIEDASKPGNWPILSGFMCHTMGWIERKKAYKTEVLNWDQVLIQGEQNTFKV